MPLEIGSLLNDRYRIIQVLGLGGMGAVYLATDESLGVPCAVKENLNLSLASARMFRREAGLLASLRHAHLPRVTNHFVLGDHQYLVMDYIEGEDLRQRLRRDGPLPERLVLAWAFQLCDILTYLHGRNPPVVHRDIKPANIKLTPAGEIALVDFGVAKPIPTDQQTATPAVAFTPGFTPPEQYGLEPIDARADQYALGATLYSLLTGQKPPDGSQRFLGNSAPVQPQALRPDLSSSTALALTRALAIMPDDRFPDVAAFKAALQGRVGPSQDAGGQNRAAAGSVADIALPRRAQPAQAVAPAPGRLGPSSDAARPPRLPPPPPGAVAAPARQGPSIWVLLGGIGCAVLVLAALVFGGAGVVGYMLIRPTASPTAAPSAIPTAALATTVATDLSSTPLFALTNTPPAPSETAALETATGPAPATPVGTASAPATTPPPVVTPAQSSTPIAAGTPIGQGGRLAFISNRDGQFFQIYTMSPDGGGVRQVTTDPTNKWDPKWPFNGTQLAWSPNGGQLLYVAEGAAGDGTDIFLVNADGTNPLDLTTAPGDDFQPAWCSDGSIWFASTRINGVHQIFHTDLKSIGQGRKPINFSATHNSPREYDPTLYPGCQRVLFVTTLNGAPELWHYWPDCLACYRLIRSAKDQGGKTEEPALSPDGKAVAYTQSLSGVSEIMFGLIDDHTVTMQLTKTGGNSEPQWSPDGQWLVFVSTRDGNRQIYRMTRAGASQINLTNEPAIDTDPVWQPAP
jgi:Tol biopolymer transport system component